MNGRGNVSAAALAAVVMLSGASGAAAGEILVDFSDGLFPGGDGPVTYHGITFINNGGGSGGPGMNGTIDWGFYFANIGGSSQGLALNDQWGDTDLRMEFPAGTTGVSMLVSTGPQTRFALDLFGEGGDLLRTVEGQMPADAQAAVIGGEEARPISAARLYEPDGENFNITLVDDIRYTDEGGQICYPDLNGDTVLDLFDFLEFTNLFNAGDDAADCEADGAFDLFDFLCYTNAFNAGC
jgi:hypothetical protein